MFSCSEHDDLLLKKFLFSCTINPKVFYVLIKGIKLLVHLVEFPLVSTSNNGSANSMKLYPVAKTITIDFGKLFLIRTSDYVFLNKVVSLSLLVP